MMFNIPKETRNSNLNSENTDLLSARVTDGEFKV